MKIRIVELFGNEYNDDCYSNLIYSFHDMTDWFDATEEEVEALKLWIIEENKKDIHTKIVLISEKIINYKKTIDQYLEKARNIKEEMLEAQWKAAEKEAKRIERYKKSEEKRKEKQKEKKLKLLEKLKEEFNQS